MPDRLFVAIWPDDSARVALSETIGPARHAVPDVRWQSPERWHITLAFLGAADPARSADRIAALSPRGALEDPEPIRLTGAGTFGPVLWVGVEHGVWLNGLATALQHALRAQDHRFRAHVTVGRLRGADAPALARAATPLLVGHHGPPWTPREITLVESRTGPRPEYRIVGRWPLVAPKA